MSAATVPKALDHSHHLSDLARARESSPLKSLIKYMGKPGIISLGGGFPHPGYFPFESISANVYAPDAFPLHNAPEGTRTNASHGVADVQKYGGDINLASALQYTLAMGIAPLRTFIRDFTTRVFEPAYADFVTYTHAGNTDAWSIIVDTLFNPGQGYFTEEFTYPSAQATAVPHGVKPVPIKIDAQGLSAEDLRRVCEGWDEAAHGGMKRPHVLYTVPVGHNPCGTTMGAERKKLIYDICVEYDIIIVEDDPYYFLQQEPYVLPQHRTASTSATDAVDDEAFLSKLAPSFLKFDYQGRVIRLDSFSKTIAPGARLGWYTCSPLFAERFERQAETSTQNPNGFGQALVGSLLTQQWKGVDGYLRWLRGLRAQYTIRRDFTIDAFARTFVLTPRGEGDATSTVLVASSSKDSKPLFEFVPPVGGMFIWIKLHLSSHPAHPSTPTEIDELERSIWVDLAENGLLVTPGWYFNAAALKGQGHFRIAFSYSDEEEMVKAIAIFARVIKSAFGDSGK
ncbi:PLP-dependent transferase [Exidia glandulosa HHB12029]|uniref:PLP-dependent transferase n=1 Tax=Exidia glandulosa HHB12029 TaxID=1314781 RepID=A0A165E3G9_EXIGL|nr:PLP-dependent transferase [Exidia glandulosa HHB12029]